MQIAETTLPAEMMIAERELTPSALLVVPALLPQPTKLRLAADDILSNVAVLWTVVIAIYVFAAFHAIQVLDHPKGAIGELPTFRNAAMALSHGRDIYAGNANEYVYPPLIAFLYQPFGWMSVHVAGIVDLAINGVVSFLTLWLAAVELCRRFLGRSNSVTVARAAVVAALLTSDKLRAEFNMWETNALMLLAFAVALYLADRRPWWAGAALGFAFNVKYLPLTFLPYLILRRRWGIIGGFVASAVFFSLLPAVSLGWSGNLHALASAYNGLAGLFGIHVARAAHVYAMTDKRTISITSAIARYTGWSDKRSVFASAAIGLAFIAAAVPVYRRNRIPFLRWPAASKQLAEPYAATFGLEWIVVILLTLAFSPFTNSAHLYFLLLPNVAGAVLLISIKHPATRPLIVGIACTYAAIVYPPGGDTFRDAERTSKWIGLPSWCMLAYCASLVWVGLQSFRRKRVEAAR